MFTVNPFTYLTAFLPPAAIRAYVIAMIVAVAAGTLFDVIHKGSRAYFTEYRQRTGLRAKRQLGGGDKIGLALKTLVVDVAAAGEFCNPKRRISHLLLFYGFIAYLVTTVLMVFVYLDGPTPAVLPVLWNIGALMVLIGGGWFFFLLRADVVYDGRSPFHLVRADLFILSLLASAAFALAWEIVEESGHPAAAAALLGLYLFFTTLLFVSVPWSKFAHMFYKPAMAFQRRIEEADGSSSLPIPAAGHKRAV